MTRKILVSLGFLLLVGFSPAEADQLEEGDLELQFRFTYSHLDFAGRGGSSTFTEALGSVGYMITDHHEVGAGVAYSSFGSADSVEYGLAYNYNFRVGESLNPYLGAVVVGFGGERGDLFDLGYAAELGVKVYPWSHGGMVFGVAYRELQGAGGARDATHVIAFGGLSLKF